MQAGDIANGVALVTSKHQVNFVSDIELGRKALFQGDKDTMCTKEYAPSFQWFQSCSPVCGEFGLGA